MQSVDPWDSLYLYSSLFFISLFLWVACKLRCLMVHVSMHKSTSLYRIFLCIYYLPVCPLTRCILLYLSVSLSLFVICLSFIWLLPLFYLTSVSLLSDFYLSFIWLLSLFYLTSVSLLSDFCLSFIWLLSISFFLTMSICPFVLLSRCHYVSLSIVLYPYVSLSFYPSANLTSVSLSSVSLPLSVFFSDAYSHEISQNLN